MSVSLLNCFSTIEKVNQQFNLKLPQLHDQLALVVYDALILLLEEAAVEQLQRCRQIPKEFGLSQWKQALDEQILAATGLPLYSAEELAQAACQYCEAVPTDPQAGVRWLVEYYGRKHPQDKRVKALLCQKALKLPPTMIDRSSNGSYSSLYEDIAF